ncbi:hypothetical protein GCM10022224_056450 [Nonomuraea antimicrobica]|uniref:Uncharacterized protein n=1 Tax=Nonomuraea antimicrobica TaxID=561173 RepID=A0ABP7CCX5_9ACTN
MLNRAAMSARFAALPLKRGEHQEVVGVFRQRRPWRGIGRRVRRSGFRSIDSLVAELLPRQGPGRTRPLDDLTHQMLCDWLEHRRTRWPNTANPHLIINQQSADGDRRGQQGLWEISGPPLPKMSPAPK